MEKGVWITFVITIVLIIVSVFVTIAIVKSKYAPLENDVAVIKGEYTTNSQVFNILKDCDRTGLYVDPSDVYWRDNPHPTGNSLCEQQGQVCVVALLTNVIVNQGFPPNEWGENTDAGLWACDTDATGVYGRSGWGMYRLDALCCSV